jgi:hypothetical protein
MLKQLFSGRGLAKAIQPDNAPTSSRDAPPCLADSCFDDNARQDLAANCRPKSESFLNSRIALLCLMFGVLHSTMILADSWPTLKMRFLTSASKTLNWIPGPKAAGQAARMPKS